MEKRKVVHQETLKKWKAIKIERSNQMRKPETPPPGSRKTEPKPGKEQEAPPKKTMQNQSSLQTREELARVCYHGAW
jgi:hypothetical protein